MHALTRAARRKAGLSPPPSLFKNALAPTVPAPPAMTPPLLPEPATRDSNSDISGSSSSSEEEGEEGNSSKTQLWVQCEHLACKKWRPLRKDDTIDAKSAWYCSMHPDPSLQSCAVPEGKWKTSKRGYTFSKLNRGQLVWAKMRKFPPWPAIITPDPWSDNDYVCKERAGFIYHVEFLGKTRSHLWMIEEKVEPYHRGSSSLGCLDTKNAPLKAAILEANGLIGVSGCDRLKTCRYSTRETAKWTKKKPKLTVKEAKTLQDTVTPAKSIANIPKLCDLKSVRNFGSLEMLLAGSSFNLKEFIQSNFTTDSSGVLRLAKGTAKTGKNTAKTGKEVLRKKKMGTLVLSTDSRTPASKPGRKPRNKPCTYRPHARTAVYKRISPTIPDYFDSSNSTVCVNRLPQEDQVVPDTVASAEAQALQELEEIEGMLTIFEGEDGSKPVVPGALKELEEIEGMLATLGDSEVSSKPSGSKEGEFTGRGRRQEFSEERERTERKQNDADSATSKWVESVVGDINEIEDLIRDLSRSEVVLY